MSEGTAATDSMVNRSVLGRYRIVRRLAQGGMGAVYLGRTEGAEGFARPVVVKRVLPALMDDDSVAQMFVREARILANLHHQGIVAVLDFGQDADGGYVMVLEYVHGYSLASWRRYVQRTRGQIPVDIALHLVVRVLDALHYAHTFKRADGKALQVIHRDVSPSNVLLDTHGNVKLLDFGIARVSGDDAEFKTDRSALMGKLPYMAPEIFKESDPSVQSDVYAAGVMLYELLSGKVPFAGGSTAQIYDRILNEVPPSLHSVRDDLPENIDELIGMALSKDPARRYETAHEFAQVLRQLRSAEEERVVEQLTEALTADFNGDMPEVLRLERLEVREQAWRQPGLISTSPGSAVGAAEQPDDGPTVMHQVEPELLAGTVDSQHPGSGGGDGPPPPPPVGGPPPLPGSGGSGHEADTLRPAATAPATPGAAPSVRFVGDDTGAHGRVNPLRGRLLIAVLVSGFLLVLGVLAVVLLVPAARDDRIVVIERQANPSVAVATRPAPPGPASAAAEAPAPEAAQPDAGVAPTPPAGAAEAPAETKTTRRPARAPNPRQLTRAFGRRARRVEACFTKHASTLEGRPQVAIDFDVTAEGKVSRAVLVPASLAGTALGKCLLRVARSVYFGPQQRAVSFHIPITAQRIDD